MEAAGIVPAVPDSVHRAPRNVVAGHCLRDALVRVMRMCAWVFPKASVGSYHGARCQGQVGSQFFISLDPTLTSPRCSCRIWRSVGHQHYVLTQPRKRTTMDVKRLTGSLLFKIVVAIILGII